MSSTNLVPIRKVLNRLNLTPSEHNYHLLLEKYHGKVAATSKGGRGVIRFFTTEEANRLIDAVLADREAQRTSGPVAGPGLHTQIQEMGKTLSLLVQAHNTTQERLNKILESLGCSSTPPTAPV